MKLAIRPASAATDQEQMVELHHRNLPDRLEGRFEWRHFANPVGPAWSWFLYEKNDGAVVAMTSVFPRHMYVNGKKVVCGQVGEFVVDAPYRSLGPALMLQRATFGPADSGKIAICYDCPPHDQGMSTFRRLGMRANSEIFRYALPLRSDEFLNKKLGAGPLAKPAIAAANLLLSAKLSSRGNQRMQGIEILPFHGSFGDEFTELDDSVSSTGLIRASRSAELLNWRFRKLPRCNYLTLVARRAGELVGFLTALDCDGRFGIGDVFGRQFEDVSVALIDALICWCRKEKASLVEGYSSESGPWEAAFLKLGFARRQSVARIVAYEKPGGNGRAMLNPSLCWAFTSVETIL
jgi:GNAT superfamily N-acetyltransferase